MNTNNCNQFNATQMGYSHSFDVNLATELGMESAVVYNHILYWIKHNFIEGKNRIEGKTWSFQAYETIHKYIPYLSVRQIREAVKRLVIAGLVIRGEFNKNKFDHTTWYSVSNNIYEGSKTSDPQLKNVTSENTELADPSYNNKDRERKKEKEGEIAALPRPPLFLKKIKSFGSHVKMTELEYDELVKIHSEKKIKEYIQRINDYCESTGKNYKGYAATIRSWIAKDVHTPYPNSNNAKKEPFASATNDNMEARKAKGGEPISDFFYQKIVAKSDRENKPEDKLWYIVEKDGGKVLIS